MDNFARAVSVACGTYLSEAVPGMTGFFELVELYFEDGL